MCMSRARNGRYAPSMPLTKFQVAMFGSSQLPRDAIVNTLHFNVAEGVGGSPDYGALCNDLAAIYNQYWLNAGFHRIEVRAYGLEGPPPHLPLGQTILNATATPGGNGPREIALCLSFRSGASGLGPRRRGRIFLPVTIHTTASTERPSPNIMTRALALAQHFADLGGTNVDWNVYSTRDQHGYQVTDAWVDDEWDIQRRRGYRPTTRQTAHVGP